MKCSEELFFRGETWRIREKNGKTIAGGGEVA